MTPSANVVPLSRSLDIPFNKLILSQANVRHTNAGMSITELSQDIGVRGLLQSLNVRPILDENGKDTGKYEVPAGGRRYRALEQLVKAKRLPKTALIPCVIKGDAAETSLEDDSLAENTQRLALHPLDQYRAFLALRRQNMSEEDIAARYFVSVQVVKQRLRLAAVSPKLLNLYAAETLTLDQLTAFSITNDHERQEKVWDALAGLQNWQKTPHDIRRQLTEAAVAATDRRAVFIGVEAYQEAGGQVLTDLFSADNGGWLQDAMLLDRLVSEKLQAIADGLKAEGWKCIEVLPSIPYDHFYGLRKLEPLRPDLNEEGAAALEILQTEYDDLMDAFADFEELPDEVDERMGELETAIEAIREKREEHYDPADMARAGIVVSIDRNGQAQIIKAYVRREDEAPAEDSPRIEEEGATGRIEHQDTAIVTLGDPSQPATALDETESDSGVLRPLPEKLILELTAYRTIALRDAIARNPRVAMTLLLHKLVGDTFNHRFGGSCLQVSVLPPSMLNIAPKGLNEAVPADSMAHRHSLWGDVIPHDDQALWTWLEGETDDVRAELLAFCISFGVNAIIERPNPYGAGTSQHGIDTRLKHAMRVAQATDLDLVALGWRPTADTYLNRVPRVRILEAVREGCGERTAQMIDHLKKGDMVIEAERLLSDAGWLPEVLRGPGLEEGRASHETEALPAFLDDAVDHTGINPDTASVAAE